VGFPRLPSIPRGSGPLNSSFNGFFFMTRLQSSVNGWCCILHWGKGNCFGFACGHSSKQRGLKVTHAQTESVYPTSIRAHMSPFQHGEVVSSTHDGAETDLDLVTNERFVSGHHEPPANNLPLAVCTEEVLRKERPG